MSVSLSWHWKGRRKRECTNSWINLPEEVSVPGKLERLIVNSRGLGEHRSGAGEYLPRGQEILLCWPTFPEESFHKKKISLFLICLSFATSICFQRLTGKSQVLVPKASCLLPIFLPGGMLLHSHSAYGKKPLSFDIHRAQNVDNQKEGKRTHDSPAQR